MSTRKFYIISVPYISLRLNVLAFVLSAAIYIAFSIYLYQPHLNSFDRWREVFIPAANIAAAGAFLLASRWVSNPTATFFAGALYAFGPFTLGFALYQPLASMLLAIIPWLFLPAAFWPHTPSKKTIPITAALTLIPFIAIAAFFFAAARYGFFPIPLGQHFHLTPYISLLSPLAVSAEHFPVLSFYHVPVAALIFGAFLFIRLHRAAAIILLAAGIVLGSGISFGQISPIVWVSIPVLCISIIIAMGINGLALAGPGDSIWLVICAVLTGIIAIACALLASTNGPALTNAALWYFLSAMAVFTILVLSSMHKQYHLARWVILSILLAADIFVSARSIIDRLF